MKKFNVNTKTSFYTPQKRIKIFDSRGILFYDSKRVPNFNGRFTLPKIHTAGYMYKTKGKFQKVDNFQNYDLSLPTFERDKQNDFSEFKIAFARNPYKCTIFHRKKLILFDNSFLSKPYYHIAFILFHEVGHNWYNTEELADTYSVKTMLKKGYTPFQILEAADKTLSGKNNKRKKNVLEVLKKSIHYER